MTISSVCLTWIGCINILRRCNSTKVQRRNIAQRSMLDESCLLRLIHVQNFGSCCTSCQMWCANIMKVTSSYFRVKVTHPQNFIILRERQLNCFRLLDKLEFTLYYFPTANGIETIFHCVRLTLQFVEDELKE